jgi:hypothetical protein
VLNYIIDHNRMKALGGNDGIAAAFLTWVLDGG